MGLEFLIKLFLKGRTHNCTSSKNCHSGQGFPSGGTPHELYVPLITAVPPIKSKNCPPPPLIFVDHDKKFSDIFQSLHDKG